MDIKTKESGMQFLSGVVTGLALGVGLVIINVVAHAFHLPGVCGG